MQYLLSLEQNRIQSEIVIHTRSIRLRSTLHFFGFNMFKTKVKPTTSNTSNQVKEADFSANLENDLNYDKDISLHLVKREEISTKCDEEC